MNTHEHLDRRQLIDRMFGPSQPELTCEQCFDSLDLYVEAELRGDDRDRAVANLAAHLDGCPACREDYESLRDFTRTQDQR